MRRREGGREGESAQENDRVSVLLVVSNDGLLPPDLTTHADLFFHVTCEPANGEATADEARQALVVRYVPFHTAV